MDDRTSASNLTVSSSEQSAYRGGSPLRQRFPTIAYLREHARHHIPRFAFEYCDGGAGSDKGIARNWSALDGVELVPRYGVMPSLPKCDVELFGQTEHHLQTRALLGALELADVGTAAAALVAELLLGQAPFLT